MKFSHSFITWDCCFRDFFHLIPSLSQCNTESDNTIEVILVEQRTREEAEKRARQNGVQMAEEVAGEVSSRINVDVIYMNDDGVYHPGKALNHGIKKASGEIVSAMDADILVPERFVNLLDLLHSKGERLVTMNRLSAAFPCGTTKENWKDQVVDYELVSQLSPKYGKPIPEFVGNKAPLLSTRKNLWEEIGFYDEHFIFSTAYTKFGQDVSRRFALLRPESEIAMPVSCVHPFHPTPMQRKSKTYKLLYDMQEKAMVWSESNRYIDVKARQSFYSGVPDSVYIKVWNAIEKAEEQDSQKNGSSGSEKIGLGGKVRKYIKRIL